MLAFEQVLGVGVGSGESDAVGVDGAVVGLIDGVPHAARTAVIAKRTSPPGVKLRTPVIRAEPPKRDGSIVMRRT
jgi:hypothetical protein